MRALAAHPLTALCLAGAVLVAGALSSCTSPTPHDDELYRSARDANLRFKEAVAKVLTHISDDSWQVQEYGDLPVDCHPGYAFALHRTTYEGWRLPTDAATTAAEIAGWLRAEGWTVTDPEPGAGAVVVQASDHSRAIDSLVVEVRDGTGTADAIGVGAASDCVAGDAEELRAQLYPGYPDRPVDHDPLPVTEPPDATPIFGFTADGAPR